MLSNQPISKKTRATKACDQCSRYRRKCSMDTPCALCVEKGRNCTYTKILRTRGPGLNSIPSKIVENPLLASNSTIPSKSLKLKTKVSNLQDFDADTPLQSTTSILSPLSQQSHSIISPPAIETSIEAWKKSEFLSKIIIDCKGNSGSILDLYFNFPYQHLPMFSKVWLTNNIEDVPMHVLHIIYMLVLTNARQSLINGRMTAKPHEDFVQKQVDIHINNCDPFLVSTILNLAVYYFYIQDFEKSSLEFAKAVKYAQLLKLHIDVDLEWTCDSGRTLGSEIGMDKQFLRSIWFLIYQWDTYTMLLGHGNTLVESSIPDKVLAAYIPPNIGDPSNVPLNWLSHTKYSIPLISLAKQIFLATCNQSRMELICKLDSFRLGMPTHYTPRSDIFLGRTISWLNEVYNYSKLFLLVPLHLDPNFVALDVCADLYSSINAMFTLAVAFVSFSNNQITSDQTFCLFSKTLYVAALTKCTLESPTTKEIDLVIEAIKLSGNPQDYGILRTAGRDQEKAREALLNILTLRQ